MNIGEKTVRRIVSVLAEQLLAEAEALNQAYHGIEGKESLDIQARINLKPAEEGALIKVSTSFATGRISLKTKINFDENQGELNLKGDASDNV